MYGALMAKPKVLLEKNKGRDGGSYRLILPPLTLSGKIKELIKQIVLTPYTIYQTIVGRLLSYLVINPLFRKEEKDESRILQNPKHPDPLFNQDDELFIVNIYPKRSLLASIVLNWHNYFVNSITLVEVVHSMRQRLLGLFASDKASADHNLDLLVERVAAKIKTNKKLSSKQKQISFRGLAALDSKMLACFYDKLEERIGYNFRPNKEKIYHFSLQTTDNAVLDSVEIRNPKLAAQDISERHFIIACMPRSNNYVDWIKQYRVYAKNLDATIIAFNYRGIGLSKGIITSQNSLYMDAYAQAQRLLALGAKSENIAFMGECLGGNIAAYAAGSLQKEGFAVKLFNARSFSSLTAVVNGKAKPSKEASLKHLSTWLHWFGYAVVKLLFIPIIYSARWSLNVETQFAAIPPHDRDYLVVRSKKGENGERFADDKMISHKTASTYAFVKEQIKVFAKKKKDGCLLTTAEEEWLHDNPNDHKFYVSEDLHHKARSINGHTALPRLLVPTNPDTDCWDASIDGRQYLFNFFKRIWSKEPITSTSTLLSTTAAA